MITFEKIRWKNLLSYGNVWTEVDLKRSPNTLIVGENGSGKSTILDALCYVLFSRPFRKVTKKQLVNSVNTKGTSIEVEFTVGKNHYNVPMSEVNFFLSTSVSILSIYFVKIVIVSSASSIKSSSLV